MKIYVTGISGSGKSSIVKEFSKRGISAFSIDEVEGMCCWVNQKTQSTDDVYSPSTDWLDGHDWICKIDELKKLFSSNKDLVIVTGIATNQDDYLGLFDKIFLLQSSKETLLKRMQTRHLQAGENNFGQYPEEREFAIRNYKNFENKMIALGAVSINSEFPINEVADQIILKI